MNPETQVHISKDGFDIQTTYEMFRTYYKRIGWQFIDLPPYLPGIAAPEITETTMAELQSTQGVLL